LAELQHGLEQDMAQYRLSEAYERIYHFVWDDLADWYIEASKGAPNTPLLMHVLQATLIMAHPFAPFVTETIWQTLDAARLPAESPTKAGDSVLAMQRWPEPAKADAKQAAIFGEIQTIVVEARYIVKTLQAHDVTLYYTDVPFLSEHAELIKRLAHLRGVQEVRDGNGLYLTNTSYRCWLDIDAETASHFAHELQAKVDAQKALVERLEARLASKDYTSKAPKAVVKQTEDQLDEAKAQLETLGKEYERFAN
jgi:valyl-tRNA synthetase